jgi:hypothetical protein
MLVIESINGGWGYCPAEAPLSFRRCMVYDDAPTYPTLEAAILGAERDRSIPQDCRPLHFTPQFAPKG